MRTTGGATRSRVQPDRAAAPAATGRIRRLLTLALIAAAASPTGCTPRGAVQSAASAAGATSVRNGMATIVVDASEFIAEIQKDHVITHAAELGVPWLFNNTALVMRSRSNYVLPVGVPEAGTYYLYTRSHGSPDAYFRVAVGDEVIDHDLGNGPLRFERSGVFDLAAGPVDVRLMRIEGGPVLDVLVLSQDPDLTEEKLVPLQLSPDVQLRRRYEIPAGGTVKFGDLTGDGRTDFMVVTDDYSAYAYGHDGALLWSYISEEKSGKDEPPGLIWDLDQDGVGEAIHWRYLEGKEWLVVADGRTGEVLRRTVWTGAALPHPFNNYRLVVARLRPGYPEHIVSFTDTGGTIEVDAYDRDLELEWRHTEVKLKDHLGHYAYPVDLDGDGVDEIAVSSLVLSASGEKLWDRFDLFYDHHDHVDSYRFADLDGDGQDEMVAAHSEVGMVVYDARDGDLIWQSTAEHTQQVEVGDFLDAIDGPHVAAGARTYGNRSAGEAYLWSQVWWFDREGHLFSKWPGRALNGNPEFVKGDWAGDGKVELFWYKFRMKRDGTGELYFADPVYHMFDFEGDAAEEVITRQDSVLSVYGSSRADPDGERVERSADYVRERIVNHTHY